jgi:hypothetical protein
MTLNVATPDALSSSSPTESCGMRCARRVSTESRDESPRCKTLLPEDFIPAPYSVVCGRGMKCSNAVGNRRLQVIATMFINKYSLAHRKEDKTEIVTEILKMVQDACPDERFAFVRYHDGRWWEVETLIAREKIGAVLRDCLHSKYRSSTKSKLERRKAQRLSGSSAASTGSDGFSMMSPCGFGIQSNAALTVIGECYDNVFS